MSQEVAELNIRVHLMGKIFFELILKRDEGMSHLSIGGKGIPR